MSAQAPGAAWDFRPALKVLHADDAPNITAESSESTSESDGGVVLETSNPDVQSLGTTKELPPRPVRLEDEGHSDDTLVPKSPAASLSPKSHAVAQSGDTRSSGSEKDSWADHIEDPFADVYQHAILTKNQRKKARKRANKAREKEEALQSERENVLKEEEASQTAQKHAELMRMIFDRIASQQAPSVSDQKPKASLGHSSNPLQLLIKAQEKRTKSAATAAVTPPVTDSITPSLSLYAQQSYVPSAKPVRRMSRDDEHTLRTFHHPSSGNRPDKAITGPVPSDPFVDTPKDPKPKALSSSPLRDNQSARRNTREVAFETANGLFAPLAVPPHPVPARSLGQDGRAVVSSTANQGHRIQHQEHSKITSTAPLSTQFSAVKNQYANQSQYASAVAPLPQAYHGQMLPAMSSVNARMAAQSQLAIVHGLIPSSVTRPSPSSKTAKKTVVISREDRDWAFQNHLINNFPADRKYFVGPRYLLMDQKDKSGIHVFIDASNIQIGFKDALKFYQKGACELSMEHFLLLLERRRPIAKRVYAGSAKQGQIHHSVAKHTDVAKAIGYKVRILEQVYKAKEPTERQRFHRDADRMGYGAAKAAQIARANANALASGSGSDSETGAALMQPPLRPPSPKWHEQGVDEQLHLEILQSLLDYKQPSTIVLATGDGAEAEYSDGFLGQVKRALKNGWRVELVTWGRQCNSGYRDRSFRQKWGEQFTIVELDRWLDFLTEAP